MTSTGNCFRTFLLACALLAVASSSIAAPAPPAAAPAAASVSDAQLAEIFQAYLAVHAALVASDAAWASKHARTMATAAAVVPELERTLQRFPAGLADQRVQFSAVSNATIELAAQHPKAAAGLNVAFCGMAKGYWLQRGSKVKNPYYGAAMLTCGEILGPPKSKAANR